MPLIIDRSKPNLQSLQGISGGCEVRIFGKIPPIETEIQPRRHNALQVKCHFFNHIFACGGHKEGNNGYSNNYYHANSLALLQRIGVSVIKPVHAGSVIKVAYFQHVKTYFSVTIKVTIMIICILAF